MKRSSFLKGITGAVMLCGALSLSTQASAYTFDVCEAGGFNSATDANDALNGVAPTTNGACIPAGGTSTGVSWFPNSPNKSSVEILFHAFSLELDLTQDSDMAMDIIATISQVNNVIFSSDSIGGSQGFPYSHTMAGTGNFILKAEDGTEVFADPNAFFSIEHTETRNAGCPTNFTNTTCEDIWDFQIIPPPGTSFDFVTADAPGFLFTASFDLVVLPPNIVIGNTVYTPETSPGMSSVDVKFSISSLRLPQQVPEPGTLALFGLGLAGIGLAARRKRAL